ncbi:ATP-binding protein [Sorangium atrum]|uniref:histidine kinase n=1 Tax=Sorangium atrum TaxID=2995308 RepID=A0ABT5CDA4_9BACT|nr:ATP-binding protein [Sorangium aterium]MDC0684380.1 PAS domain-containing protein [Sorangium aterium]
MSCATAPGPRTRVILIVDDVPANLGVLVNSLECIGHRVLVAQGGEEALMRASLMRPDLILLDVLMPGIDGFETCRRLKAAERTQDIPVLFMTCLTDASDKLVGFRAGGVDYITRPFEIGEVIARITTHLSLREAQRELEEKNAELQRVHQELEQRVRERTTELASSNAALRESQHLLQAIVDNTAAVVFAKDMEGRYMLVNSGFEELFQMRREQVIGKTDHDLFPREQADAYCANDLLVLQQNRAVELDEVAPERDGVRTYLSLKFPLRGSAGEPDGVCGISTEITSRKNAEDVLRHSYSLLEATLESTADGILVVDGARRVVRHNDRLAQMWRIPTDVLAGGSADVLLALVGGQLREPELFLQSVRDLYADPEASAFGTFPLRNEQVFEWYTQPQRLGGRVAGRVWSFRDITARVHAEQQRDRLLLDERRARAAAEEATRLRDEFLLIASHELRTPVTSLQLSMQSLGQRLSLGMDAERVRSAVALSGRQIKRLSNLVDMLLDVSRIQAGRLELDRAPVDLRELVAEIAAQLGDQLAQSGSTLAVRAEQPITGWWDRYRLEQVVTNLLTNAIKFGEREPIEITITAEEGVARLSVADHGLGIPAEVRTQLFERFRRGVSSRNYGGLGLGLFITRTIVEAHGGRIRLSSEVGQGSTFCVELPLSTEGAGSRCT